MKPACHRVQLGLLLNTVSVFHVRRENFLTSKASIKILRKALHYGSVYHWQLIYSSRTLQLSREPATPFLSWARLIQSMPPTHFLKIHFNIILPSKPGSFKWSHSLGLPTKILFAPFLTPVHATFAAHLSLLDLITRMIFGEQYRA